MRRKELLKIYFNMNILNKIQQELKAPKNQRNTFGNYNYRSCEDILEAVKPLLGEATLIIEDEIVMLGDRYYVKATAKLSDGKETYSASAFARESLDKKGMDSAQITGATSSYARKYALNGLFLIDDTKDADHTETHGKDTPQKAKFAPQASESDKVCSLCGTEAKVSPKSGKDYCPNWKNDDHKNGTFYKIISKGDKAFDDSLPVIEQ